MKNHFFFSLILLILHGMNMFLTEKQTVEQTFKIERIELTTKSGKKKVHLVMKKKEVFDVLKVPFNRYIVLVPYMDRLTIWTLIISLKVTNFIDKLCYMFVKKSSWKENLAWRVQKSTPFTILKETIVFVLCWL